MKITECMKYRTFKRTLLLLACCLAAFTVVLISPVIQTGQFRISMVFLITIVTILAVNIMRPYDSLHENLFRYRYLIGGVIFVSLVMFEIHGSSISLWADILGSGDLKPHTIAGVRRIVRSDEWAVSTPMALSQYLNKGGAFPYFSGTIRGDLTDVFIVYSQPVLDIVSIFKPFYWGYLLLSPGRGLSFFWMGRLLVLFLVSIDFGMLLTDKKKGLSVAYACMIAFAPVIQWWFAINGIVEIFVYGQLAILILRAYMKTDDIRKRCFYAFIIAICAGGYLLVFYPAWQIPMFYVFAVLGIWVLVTNWRKRVFGIRDLIPAGIILLVFGGGMALIFSRSYETISSVMNTAFPGERLEIGGGMRYRIFESISNFSFTFESDGIVGNVCEHALFYDLYPLGVILAGIVIIFQKNRDKLIFALLGMGGFLYAWCCWSWPEWLAKVTLLSNSQSSRAIIAVGFINILILIRALSMLKIKIKGWVAAGGALLITAYVVNKARAISGDYLTIKLTIVTAAVFCIFILLVLLANRKKIKMLFYLYTAAVMGFMGMTVNPVVYGVDIVTEQPLVKAVQEIVQEEEGLWIVEGEIWYWGNLLLMAGAPTINSTNVYPNLERWSLLDEDGIYEEIYNRYAHITIDLQNDQDTHFTLEVADLFNIELHVEDLETLGIRYIVTKNTLESLSSDNVSFSKVAQEQNFSIYQVNY